MNDFKTVLPKSATDWDGKVKLFAEKSKMLTSQFYPVATREEAFKTLKEIAVKEGWKSVGSHHTELTDSAVAEIGLPCLWTNSGYDKVDLEKVDAGITCCDALIAQTGSAFLSAKSAGGRVLSILPPHHVIIATKEQLLSDLPDAYKFMQEKYNGSFPSMMTLITGPSRTGDIERILVLGAHGPKKLSIILISNS